MSRCANVRRCFIYICSPFLLANSVDSQQCFLPTHCGFLFKVKFQVNTNQLLQALSVPSSSTTTTIASLQVGPAICCYKGKALFPGCRGVHAMLSGPREQASHVPKANISSSIGNSDLHRSPIVPYPESFGAVGGARYACTMLCKCVCSV